MYFYGIAKERHMLKVFTGMLYVKKYFFKYISVKAFNDSPVLQDISKKSKKIRTDAESLYDTGRSPGFPYWCELELVTCAAEKCQ